MSEKTNPAVVSITQCHIYEAAKQSIGDTMLSLAVAELVDSVDFRRSTERYLLDVVDGTPSEETRALIRYLVDHLCDDVVLAYMTDTFANMVNWEVRLGFVPLSYVKWDQVRKLHRSALAALAVSRDVLVVRVSEERAKGEQLKSRLFSTSADAEEALVKLKGMVDSNFRGSLVEVVKQLCVNCCESYRRDSFSWRISVSKVLMYVRCLKYGFAPYVPEFSTTGPATYNRSTKCVTVVAGGHAYKVEKLKFSPEFSDVHERRERHRVQHKNYGNDIHRHSFVSTYADCLPLTSHWKRILRVYMNSCEKNAVRTMFTAHAGKQIAESVLSSIKPMSCSSYVTGREQGEFFGSPLGREREIRNGVADVMATVLDQRGVMGPTMTTSCLRSDQHQTVVDELEDLSTAAVNNSAFANFFKKVLADPEGALEELRNSPSVTRADISKGLAMVRRLRGDEAVDFEVGNCNIVDLPKGQQMAYAFDTKTGPNDVEDVMMTWLTFWKSTLSGRGSFQKNANNITYSSSSTRNQHVGRVYETMFVRVVNGCGETMSVNYDTHKVPTMCVNDLIMMRAIVSDRGCEDTIAEMLGIRPSRAQLRPLNGECSDPLPEPGPAAGMGLDNRVVGAAGKGQRERDHQSSAFDEAAGKLGSRPESNRHARDRSPPLGSGRHRRDFDGDGGGGGGADRNRAGGDCLRGGYKCRDGRDNRGACDRHRRRPRRFARNER